MSKRATRPRAATRRVSARRQVPGSGRGRNTTLARLRADLSSGRWAERNRPLLALDALDLGYRLACCEIGRTSR